MRERGSLPQVADMEKYVLSAMLINEGAAIPTVASMLREDDFYREEHRIVFRAIMKIYLGGKDKKVVPDLLSLMEELRADGDLGTRVDPALLFALGDMAYTTAYAENHAKKILEKSMLRHLIEVGEEIAYDAYEDQKPAAEILDNAEKKILEITSRTENNDYESVVPILQRAFEKIERQIRFKGQANGVPSGFYDLDKITNGFQKSDFIILAARPSMGKTAFALNVAVNAAKKKKVVAVFSLEMSKEQLGNRLLSSESNVDSLKLRVGEVDAEDLSDLVDTLAMLSELPMIIDDTAGISVFELRSKARKIKNEHGLDLLLIDYLQLMRGNSSSRNLEANRQQEIAEISRSLKSLARELNVPIIALSQLSRNVELRAEKKPQLSDLRESGSLEQDADMVMFLYREEYYNKETDKGDTAELIIAKNRNGPTKNIPLSFKKETMKFNSVAYE